MSQIEKMNESIKLFKRKTSKMLIKSQSILQTIETAENKHRENLKMDIGKRPDENNNQMKNNQIFNEDFALRHSFIYNEKENTMGKKQIGYGSGFFIN